MSEKLADNCDFDNAGVLCNVLVVEIRVDAWKLCQVCRRPEPRSAEDIGTWYGYGTVYVFVSIIFVSTTWIQANYS